MRLANHIQGSRKLLLTSGLLVWGLAIAACLHAEWQFSRTPGSIGAAASEWPEESRIARADSAQLLLFVHPRCPCSEASLSELANLLSATGGRLAATVVLWQPASATADWRSAELVAAAAKLPGVTLFWDVGGYEAARFGAETSGHVVCFDEQGSRQFTGGITIARGQVGDNLGSASIRTWLQEGTSPDRPCCVYGCPLTMAPRAGSSSQDGVYGKSSSK